MNRSLLIIEPCTQHISYNPSYNVIQLSDKDSHKKEAKYTEIVVKFQYILGICLSSLSIWPFFRRKLTKLMKTFETQENGKVVCILLKTLKIFLFKRQTSQLKFT